MMKKRRKPIVQQFSAASSPRVVDTHFLTAADVSSGHPRIGDHDIATAGVTVGSPEISAPFLPKTKSPYRPAPDSEIVAEIKCVRDAGDKPSKRDLPRFILPRLQARGLTASDRHIMSLDDPDRPRRRRGERRR
jgi:hypothetical protein